MQRRTDLSGIIEPRLRSLDRHPDFDLELYRDACAHLADQERACVSLDELQRLSHGWFRDAFFPREKESQLQAQTAIPPLWFEAAMDARFLHMPEGGMFSTWDIRPLTTSDRLEGALYGDRLFTRIRSGIILTGPSDMFDLLGTGELDCCTAIAGLRKNGSLLLGHIPGPHAAHLLETISKLKSFDLDRAYLIHPQLPTNGYRDPTHAERAKDGNETYKNIAEKFGMRRIGYASSSFPGEREPDQYSSLRTLVTINRDGVCISLNRERVSSYLVPNDGRHLRMHYEPLATGTFAWDEA